MNWDALRHAYGSAGDLRDLLDSARTAPQPASVDSEPWFSIWSRLCHQGDIYTASIAAVPDLVGLASLRGGAIAETCLHLVGCIEMTRVRRGGPEIPSEFAETYEQSLEAAREMVRTPTSDSEGGAWVSGFVSAVLDGRVDLARAMELGE